MFSETIITVFLATWFMVMFGAEFLNQRRRDGWDKLKRNRKTYHCVKCSHLYELHGETDTHGCPRCGHKNVSLKF